MANRIFALIGPHASGKARFARELIARGIHYIPFYTTRQANMPKSVGQVEIAYYQDKITFFKTDFITKDTYKGDYYGIRKIDVLDAVNRYPASVMLITPVALKQLAKLLKTSLETIYLMSDYVTLVERMIVLGHNNDEIKYHLEYAENNGEFDQWKVARHVVKNTGDAAPVINQLMAIIGLTVPAPPEEVRRLLGT